MKRKSEKQHLNLFEQDKEPVRVPPVRGQARKKKMDYNLRASGHALLSLRRE